MKVSVALATYNGAGYLQDQLDSFVRQDRQPDELIASDDASTDGTVALLEAFARSAPFAVHLHRNPANVGFIRNFDTALSLCTGDVIFLSDQDDVWFSEKIATALAALEEAPDALLFVNDAELVGEDLTPLGLTTFGQVRARGWSEKAFTQGSCFAMRRELLDWVLPLTDDYPFHDMWIADLAHDLGAVLISERPLQLFRRHGANASPIGMDGPAGRTGRVLALRDSVVEDIRPVLAREATKTRIRIERLNAVANGGDGPAGGGLAGGRADAAGGSTYPGGVRERSRRRQAVAAVGGLEVALSAIEARLAVLSAKRPGRTVAALRMLARGDYAQFSGVRSALLDMVRR